MTSLIKHGAELNYVRSLNGHGFADPELLEHVIPRHVDTAAAAHERQIAELRQALAEAMAGYSERIEAARVQGKQEAEAGFKRDETQALARLHEGVAKAVSDIRDRFGEIDGLALLLAQTALEKVFTNAPDYDDLTERAIRRQIEPLRRETVIAVSVSESDFTDDAALRKLAANVGGIEIRRDAKLPPGECCIDLRLGHIELSIPKHWESLTALFRRLAGAAA